MKALVLYGPGNARVEDVETPSPKRGWALVRVKRVGVCGTDKAFYRGSYRPLKLPIIPGHEISGVVEEVGDPRDRDLVGRRVTTEINIYCGRCWYCRNGMPTHCPYRETIGISRDGGMAEYVLTRTDLIHEIEGLDWSEGAFVEPLAAVVEMTEMQPPQPFSNIAVVGIGTIGLLSIQVLSLYSPRTIVAIARPGSPKRGLALKLGAHEVLSPEEALEYARRNTPEGAGFDYVVEATGSPAGLDIALQLVRPRGVIAAKSTHGAPVSFNYTMMVVKEVRIVGSRCGPFDKAIHLLRNGLVRVRNLVTSTYSLKKGVEAIEKSFERNQVRVHITP